MVPVTCVKVSGRVFIHGPGLLRCGDALKQGPKGKGVILGQRVGRSQLLHCSPRMAWLCWLPGTRASSPKSLCSPANQKSKPQGIPQAELYQELPEGTPHLSSAERQNWAGGDGGEHRSGI